MPPPPHHHENGNNVEMEPAATAAVHSTAGIHSSVRSATAPEATAPTTPTVYEEPQSFSSSRQRRRHTEGTPDRSATLTTTLSRLSHGFQRMAKPAKPIGEAPNLWGSIRSIILASWLNLLLVFIPVSWALHFAKPEEEVVIFIVSFFAIIPLAKLLGFATEELALRVGQTIGGLLNATLGNAVELIVAIIALTKCELRIVQSSLIGSILSNLLLVLGMCFFAGGTRFSEQGFAASAAQLNSSLLVIAVIAVLLPAAFYFAVTPNGIGTVSAEVVDPDPGADILKMSRGVSILLLMIYGSYLLFQLWSHAYLYDDNSDANFKSTRYQPRISKKTDGDVTVSTTLSSPADRTTGTAGDIEAAAAQDDEEEEPKLSILMAFGLLVVVTVLVAVTAEFLVDSIGGLTDTGTISKEFVGLILLPIVGNAAEHVTAVTVSVKDKLSLSIGVAVGSSIQIALFVIPFITIIAWIIGKPLTLLFDPFESIVVFLSVLTVNYVVADGKSNWLEGLILFMLYVIISVVVWFYPGIDVAGNLIGVTNGRC